MKNFLTRSAVLLCAAIPLVAMAARGTDSAPVRTPVPADDIRVTQPGELQTAVLAGGCFWGMEGVFEHVRGVTDVISGYAGGSAQNAEYETVSGGTTGHAESVKITFDPSKVSYGELLRIYFTVGHNPTELNRQGPDVGTQYRSVIFYANAEQQRVATAYVAQMTKAKTFSQPIVTQIVPLVAFYPAEAYHQNFMELHPTHPYIVAHDREKVEQLHKLFPDFYREPARHAQR